MIFINDNMILPIALYGHPTLKKVGKDIYKDHENLDLLIENMFETMYHSNGVGLAAHQINEPIRLFVLDAPEFKVKKVFINACMIDKKGEITEIEEGCLSVPGINEIIKRKSIIYISYHDENFNYHEKEKFDGMVARIIQHEYDHIEGKLFIEHIPNFKKMLLKSKLRDISTGKVNVNYRILQKRKKEKINNGHTKLF